MLTLLLNNARIKVDVTTYRQEYQNSNVDLAVGLPP